MISALLLLSIFWASAASAELTPSEQVVVRQYVGSAQTANVQRVRSVVARPDLSAEESAGAMSQALSPVPFTDARAAFMRELVFGAGSQASRSVLASSAVRGLLARADAVFDRNPTFDAPNDLNGELFRIYAFISEVANAGSPTMQRHDAAAGIDGATYESCSKALGEHLKRHSAHLGGSAQLTQVASRVRAQAMLAAFDMGQDSPTRTIDGADRVGLDATRRQLVLERGIFVLDSGKSPNGLTAAMALVRRFRASALDRVEAIYFGDEHPSLKARGLVLGVKNDLDSASRADGFPADEVTASPALAALSDLAGQLAFAATKNALAGRGDLRLAVQRDATAAGTDAKKLLGAPVDATPEAVAASAVRMLLVDAPRTMDLALARFLGGRPESLALASDAIGVLAASAGPDAASQLVLGKPDENGTLGPLAIVRVQLSPNGTAAAFALSGQVWTIARDAATGTVTGVHRDGQPLAFAMLQHARIPISGGTGWTGGGLALTPLFGSPLVGVVAGPRIRMVGQGDFDVASMQAPGDDVSVDADVVTTGPFSVLLRAKNGRDGGGIGLRIAPSRMSIVNVGADGTEHELSQSSALASVNHVHVEVRGTKLRAVCTQNGQTPVVLEAPVPAHQAHGDVALVVKKGTSLELGGVTVRRL
jgi:hypothetical protein